MTNIYNGVIENVEHSLGLKRRETEQALRELDAPLPPDELLRHLFGKQYSIAQWHEETAEGGRAGNATRDSLMQAQDIGLKLLSPLFSRDTRSAYYTRVGGNILAGLMDLWVQQDPYTGTSPRSAHLVEYDMINMEGVKLAVEKLLAAADENNRGRPSRMKTTAQRFTDGYIRIVNGLVYEAFEDEMLRAGITHTDAHIYPARLSNGDEFRLIVAGLNQEQIVHAMQAAQEKVQKLACDMGFDALPHLKHLGDDKQWANITSLKALSDDEAVYKAFKYGGAGIKIGAVELGEGLPTAEVEHLLDLELHSCREKRAAERDNEISRALIRRGTPGNKSITRVFNKSHPHAGQELGVVSFSDPKCFKYLMQSIKQENYRRYYKRPEVEARDFPFPITEERRNALPANNPDKYAREFTDLISQYVGLSDSVRTRLENHFRHNLPKPAGDDKRARHVQVAAAVMEGLTHVLDGSHPPAEMKAVLAARAQLEEKRATLTEKLAEFCNTLNPYESLDDTRARILDRKADELGLSDEQRLVYFHQPLRVINARHQDGYCMNGRVKEALKIVQSADREERMYCYIGLSSFSGTNEVSTALGRSINDHIRAIAADELRRRYGPKSLDFAFNVESGRMNLITHGISKSDLIETLGVIEKRVDEEINRQPLRTLLRRYRIFTRQSDDMVLTPHQETDMEMRHIHDEITRAREQYGHETPLAFRFQQEGEVQARPLNEQELAAHRNAIAAGNTLFLEQRSRDVLITPPKHVEAHLKRSGYVDDNGDIDLGKPLNLLPNPKHTHEKGVRVITAYVGLHGNAASLADQRKGELYRLVEYKKRHLYLPGRSHEVDIPVESNPHYSAEPGAIQPPSITLLKSPDESRRVSGYTHRNILTAGKSAAHTQRANGGNGKPKDQAGWFRMLDQREFEMWQQRQVPETLLQVISYPHIHVEADDQTFVIHVNRQNKGYDREDMEAPGRRALFIKHALEEHFGGAAVVTGINPQNLGGNRDFLLRVRPHSADGKGSYNRAMLPAREAELVKFFEDLTALKARQSGGDSKGQTVSTAKSLQQEVDTYRYHLRAIRLMRQFPTIQIEVPRNERGNFIIKLPQEPDERKSVWKQRTDNLLRALQGLLRDKAIECEEQEDMPHSSRSGGGSTKSRIKYVIRIESTSVSKDILQYMASLQQTQQIQAEGRG